MMQSAIVYIRYSTPAQESGESLERQERLTEAFCKAKGWRIVDHVYDLGRSAWKGHHLSEGKLGDLTRRIEAGLVEPGTIVVAEKFDRFARLPRRDTQAWIHKITDAGMKIALVDPGKVYDDNTSLVDDIEILLRAELAWQESEQKSERVLSAKAKAWAKAEAKEGAWVMNSRIPGWLKVKPTRDGFIVDLSRKQIVNDIYQLSADGIGAPGIAKRLNERGDDPWGTWRKGPMKWDTAQIKTILKHPAVEGDYVPGAAAPVRSRPEEIKMPGRIVGYFPRIVDADLVQRGRSGVVARKLIGKRGKTGIANLFAGLSHCGRCSGRAHIGWSTRSLNKYLRCDNASRGRGCSNKAQFNYGAFERAALDAILHLAMDERFFESTDDVARFRIELANAHKAISEAQTEKNRWMDKFGAGDDDPEVQARIRRLNEKLKALVGETSRLGDAIRTASGAVSDIEHLKRVHDIRATIYDPDEALREQARGKVQRALKSVVQTVELDPADHYRSPVDDDGNHIGDGERTVTLILMTGRAAIKFDNAGNIIAVVEGHGPTARAEGGASIEDLLRRLAA